MIKPHPSQQRLKILSQMSTTLCVLVFATAALYKLKFQVFLDIISR